MKCTINDLVLSFDKDNRLRNTIGRVTGFDVDKAYVLASFLQDDKFKKFLFDNLTNEDFLKDNVVKKEEFTNADYVKINQNKLGALLNTFYIDHYFSVNNSKTNKALGFLNGFSSGSAKQLAKDYNAHLIIEEYYKDINKPKEIRRKPEEIIRDVNEIMLNNFYQEVNKFAENIIHTDKYNKEAKDYAKSYADLLVKYNELINDYNNKKSIDNNIQELTKQIKDLKDIGNKYKAEKNLAKAVETLKALEDTRKKHSELIENNKNLKEQIKTLEEQIAVVKRDRYVIAQNLVNLYSNNYDSDLKVRLGNYANLVAQSRGDANGWYFQVFNTKKMTSIIKEFNNIGEIEEFLESEDANNDDIISKYNSDSIDETAKTWNDNFYNSFNQAISGKLKIILSNLPKLNNPYNPTDPISSIDTNNELGVETYMDAQYVTVQIFSFANKNNINDFIKSIEEKANSVKNLYSIGKLVYMMKKDKEFANYIFANFAKPIVKKTMLTVSDVSNESGIEFDYSNNNSNPLTELVFRMINKVKATYNSSYNVNDITELNNISKLFNKAKTDVEIKEAKTALFNIINKYFPNFDKDVFNNYFDNNKLDNKTKANKLIIPFSEIIRGVGKLKDTINKKITETDAENSAAWKEFIKKNNEYNKLPISERKKTKKPVPPERKLVNFAEFELLPETNSGIIKFAKELVNYTDSRARLNSTNAEGNSSSDIGKNCYITRFFEQIMAEDENDSNAGLRKLYEFVTKGTENGQTNQYSNNPLLFGVKDENGKVMVDGIFTITPTGYEINPNAKELITYNLFDGVKNTQNNNGVGYAGMAKLDFFITQYLAFANSVEEIQGDNKTKKIGDIDSAVYPMRIGSDAPKIFFIRAPKYTMREVQYAIYNHVINELNMFCNALTNVFVREGNNYITRTNVENLIGRAFFDEKTADKIKHKNGTDFTKAITDGNRLLGKMFNFYRLFNVGNYNASADIEQLLSLYGGVDKDSFFITSETGRLLINPKRLSDTSTNKAITLIETNDNLGYRFVLNLSNEQKEVLKNIVRTWTNNFLEDCKSRTNDFIKTLEDNNIKYNKNILDSFFLNLANMNMNYDDLFEGDYKYYNNARDFLKRTKETQAGGDGYAGYDILDIHRSELTELNWNGQKEYINIKSSITINPTKYNTPTYQNGQIVDSPIVARNGWRGVTIYNTNKASDYAEEMQTILERIFVKQGIKAEIAKTKSTNIAMGYGFSAADKRGDTTKINDAQSYITFEEFIRRKYADGTLHEYQDLIAQLMDPNIPVEEINLEEVNARIQVQKNFYYDIVYDANTGAYYPRQIKNAEFVLIPKLLPEGYELRKVYDWMKANDIGQLNTAETSKAAKKNIFTIWDAETGKFNENFANEFNESYIENYYYSNLYKQQDVPQHLVDAKNKAGIQIMKKIIDNVIDNTTNLKDEVKQLAKEFMDAYTANIKEDFNSFLDAMGWQQDTKTGKLINANYRTTDNTGNKLPDAVIEENKTKLNFTNFFARAREEAARLGMDSNLIEALTPNEFGNTVVPNWSNNYSGKLESIAQAVYNGRITRQTLPGWHAAQVTNIGINTVGVSKKLKFDVETGVMEVKLPRWSKLIPKGKNAEEDAAIIKQIEEEGLDLHIGYRIPTEGKQSVSVLKIVGFVNDCLGSTIIVPDEWVTQTGSDFDVDSVYGICWEMYRKTINGKIYLFKVPYEEKDLDDRLLYINYVNSKLDNKINKDNINEEIDDAIRNIRDSIRLKGKEEILANNAEFNKIDEQRNILYGNLNENIKTIIKNLNKKAPREIKDNKVIVDLKTLYNDINTSIENYINNNKLSEEDINNAREYIDLQTALIDIMNAQEGIVVSFDKNAYRSQKAEAIQNIINKSIDNWVTKVENASKDLNILSFAEFKKLPFVERLSRKARNNYILDRMIKIMKDNSSREEQYGRSKFDDVSNANNLINDLSGESARSRSPYNPLDQLDYFEDAMGGAKLKAQSVSWDSFISKNNRVRGVLSDEDAIDVILTVDEISANDSEIVYNKEELVKSYGNDIQEIENNKKSNNIDVNIKQDIDKNIGINNAKTTIHTLNSDNNELSDNEKIIIKQNLGNKPRVLVASEATDPVFHAAKIKKMVEEELAKPIGERKFHMMYLITKHDGLPLKELAELKIPKFIHFSITSLGGTKYEPGVMKMDDLLDRIDTFIKDGTINPNLVTIRIDPIIPGVTKKENIRHIIERATSMGIRQFKFSIMDSYGSSENTEQDRFVISNMKRLGYDWDKYYDMGENGKYSFNAKQKYINEYYQYMDDIAEEFKISMITCGERPNINLKRVKTDIGCINVEAMNKAMGTTDIVNVKGKQRKDCSCYGNKVDTLNYNAACASSCMYCYAKHGTDNTLKYYDEKGNLLENNFTRTVKNIITKENNDFSNNKKQILFKARRIGWSENNRNIVGEICTSYASQTTAHHLDAVKMGSVPNVDEYTFSVYKLLSSLGIDYETVIAFIRQPIISRLVANNNLINSVFVSSKNNPIKMTIANIAEDLKLQYKNKPITNNVKFTFIIDALKENIKFVEAFNQLFNIDISTMDNEDILNMKFPLRKDWLFKRIKTSATEGKNININNPNAYYQAAMDFSIILTFKNIQKTANTIVRYINATNADKYGAKPSMRETRNTVKLINELREDYTLQVNGVPFIEVMYPSINGNNNIINVDKSAYKPIAAVYNYATLHSLQTNSELFITENYDFADAENKVQSTIKHKFTESEYKEYKKYAISYVYNLISELLSPVSLNNRGMIMPNTDLINEYKTKLKTANSYWNVERSRIYGFGVVTDEDFNIENINKPKEEELLEYSKLTPAQKVLFIQRHFPDNQGIFNYIKVTLINNTDVKYRGINRQYLSYDDQIENIEDLFNMFINSFSNKNPLIRLAAIDLVKYAYIAEGLNFRSGYINKIIPNSVIYTDNADGGLDIVDKMNKFIVKLPNIIRNEKFIDNYVRSHSEIAPLFRLRPLPEKIKDINGDERYKYVNESVIFAGSTRTDGLVYFDATIENTEVQNLISKLSLFEYANGYIRINIPINKDKTNTTLYKVIGQNTIFDGDNVVAYKDYFLVPLNLLDKYENYDYSYNQNYNIYNSKEYYDIAIQQISNTAEDAREELEIKGTKVPQNYVRRKANESAKAEKKPIGNYKVDNQFDVTENKFALLEAAERADDYTKGAINKLLKGITEHINNVENGINIPYVQFNQSIDLNRLIPKGIKIEQSIFIDNNDNPIDITIEHMENSDKLIEYINKVDAKLIKNSEFEEAVQNMKDSKILPKFANFYRVTRSKKSSEENSKIALNAITDLADDSSDSFNSLPRRGNIDILSSSIINEITYISRKEDNDIAKQFVRELERRHINKNSSESLIENRENIYKSAARYYRSISNSILNKLNSFVIAGEEYSMDDPKMYEALINHDEYFNEVSRIILDGITFGNRIIDIFNLDITAEDKETKDAIESIINSINSVRQNKKLKDAMNNIFNIYFKKYSTNPEIVQDLLKLRETFGDIDKIDYWILDPSEIDNNEVQVILKEVYGMFSKAELFDAKNNVKEWKKELAKIMAMIESLDINNIIDTNKGIIKQGFNDNYLKDKQKVIEELNNAIKNKDNSLEDYKKYIIAKYNKDKFMADYTEQPIIADYYNKELALRKEVINKAGNVYVEYMKLTSELYSDNVITENEEDRNKRREIIKAKLKQLRSEVDVTGNEKNAEEATKARALNKYIEERYKLQEEYFDTQEYEGFREDYERYKKYVETYDKNNPNKSLEEKLNDVEYKTAYDWIKNNGSIKFSKEMSDKLKKSFEILTKRKTVISNDIMKRIRTIPGAIDEAGIINPLKLTDEQIELIYKSESKDLAINYDNGISDNMLIKIIPSNIPVMKTIPKSDKAKNIINDMKYINNVVKFEIINKINNILSKAVDYDSGQLNIRALFDNNVVTDEERIELAELYDKLRNLRSEKYKKFRRRNNEVYKDEINDVEYLKAFNFYKTELEGTRQGKQFLNIFTEIDAKGDMVPNSYIYGYVIPTEDYIDPDKTEARRFINDNVEFVKTEYYYQAERKAIEDGVYDEWFKKNHVYNPYTHKYQPLKIWTTLTAKPNSELQNSMQYIPTFENMEREVKKEYINDKYKQFGYNYKKGDGKYDTNIKLTEKEQALKDLIEKTLAKYTTTYQGKRFIGKGFLPRERQAKIDAAWGVAQTLSLLGLDWHSGTDSDSYYSEVDYSHDREAEMKMLGFIKTDKSKEYIRIPQRNEVEADKYDKKVAAVREKNRQITEENLKIDSENTNKNWLDVIENFIYNATIFNSRQAAKPYLYLLLEDLKINDAYMLRGMWNRKLLKDNMTSTSDDTKYMKMKQHNTSGLIHNLTRRLLFEQYHENTTPRVIANFLQNMTSAKYMVFNLYGGIANITTGKVNVAMEEYANEYFSFKDLLSAEKDYFTNSLEMITTAYSDKSKSLVGGLIKKFKVVDFDQILQFGAGSENLSDKIKQLRNFTYSFQSIGEHYMQNTVLLAMLKSNKLYTDKDGIRRIGDFKDFIFDIEKQAMEEVIKDNIDLLTNYRNFIDSFEYDTANKYDIVSGRKDINRMFLYTIRDNINIKNSRELYEKTARAYHKKREDLIKEKKDEFNNKPTVESLFEFVDGEVVLKQEEIDKFNALGKNPIGDLESLIAKFRDKVISVNKKIHGTYDKIGAAQVEKKWFGSLLMQYHKHLYPGIMKRWRRKGYYSEFRGSKERGSYQTLIDFIGTEFTNFGERVKNKNITNRNMALSSLQVLTESALNTIVNIRFNWNNLSNWEKANMRRNLGDISGALAACLIVLALYGLSDDDDIKDDRFKASLLYLADRLYSDSTMYGPIGLSSEYKTAWSSPIASANGPSDLLKAITLIYQYLFDPSFNVEYTTGQYAGENKFEILLRRNIPGIRPLDRIKFITKNNEYYKIGQSQIGINVAKSFGEMLNE